MTDEQCPRLSGTCSKELINTTRERNQQWSSLKDRWDEEYKKLALVAAVNDKRAALVKRWAIRRLRVQLDSELPSIPENPSQYEPGSLPIHTTPPTTQTGESWGDLRHWKDIPPVVCVTLKIPREKVEVRGATSRK